jgi:hypothetical protein
MVDEWPIIEKKIPSMDIVLRPVVDPSMIEVGDAENGGLDAVLAQRGAASSLSKIRLAAEEERIYRKVDGTRTVQAIIDASGMGEFEVCRILFDLLNRNIISTAGRGDAPEAFASARSEALPSRLPGLIAMGVALGLSLLSGSARWGTPFAVAGLPSVLPGSYALLLGAVSEARLGRLDRAVQAYRLATGGLPRALEDLVKAGLVDRSYLKDPWERPYHYAQTEAGYLLNGLDDGGRRLPATTLERRLPPGRP